MSSLPVASASLPFVSMNGVVTEPDNARILVWDQSFHRGDGVFEVMKVLATKKRNNGKSKQPSSHSGNEDQKESGDGIVTVLIRSLDKHLERLQTSAKGVACPLPDKDQLKSWLEDAAMTTAKTITKKAAVENKKKNTAMEDNDDNNNNTNQIHTFSLRLIATKGASLMTTSTDNVNSKTSANWDIPGSIIISSSAIPEWPATFTLYPMVAPWHPAGAFGWETPIKWTSYGPNVVSTLKAKHAGYTDALLLTSDYLEEYQFHGYNNNNDRDDDENGSQLRRRRQPKLNDCHILDGPNFAIGWIAKIITDDTPAIVCYFPCTKTLGLLPSITQRLVASLVSSKLQLPIKWGIYPLEDLLNTATANNNTNSKQRQQEQQILEVFVMSTTRGIIPVEKIGDTILPTQHPYVDQLTYLIQEYEQQELMSLMSSSP